MVLIGSSNGKIHKPRSRTRKLKWIRALYIRDGRQCAYCGQEMMTLDEVAAYDPTGRGGLPKNYPTLDHVLPRAEGGRTTLENLVIACTSCNKNKGCRTTYVCKNPIRKVTNELGVCPECKDATGRTACRICRGAGTLDVARYYEVVEMLSREAKSYKRKNVELRRSVDTLQQKLSEHGSPDHHYLLRTVEHLRKALREQNAS